MDNKEATLFQRALELEKKRDYSRALKLLDKVVSIGFNSEHLFFTRGRILREQGLLEKASENFKKAFRVSKSTADSFNGNRIINEIEICRRNTVLSSKPRGLGVVLTTRCNLRCIMCNSYETKWEIPEETAGQVISLMPYLQRVMWLGGEVFFSGYFEKLFDIALKNPELHQTVVTDGLLIDEAWARKLSLANMNLTYSIDGATSKTYEYIRRGASFADLKKSALLINQEKKKQSSNSAGGKMTTSINFTVMKSNYREIELMPDFASECGFDDLTLTPVDYLKGDENIFLNNDRKAFKYIESVIPEIEKKLKFAEITFHNWLPGIKPSGEPSGKEKIVLQSEDRYSFLCYWPWQNLFIDIGGQVKPHCLCSRKIGSVSRNSLLEIWNNSQMQNYRERISRNNYKGLCNSVCLSSEIERECMGLSW